MIVRTTARWTAAAGVAVALAFASPAMSNAQGSAHPGHTTHVAVGANNRVGSAGVHHAAKMVPTTASASSVTAPAAAQAFPSASSTVVASTGFINDTEVGYFWSVSRGDSVAQTFSGPPSIKKAILKLNVPENFLATGSETDWTVSINGKDVGTFKVVVGQLGAFTATYKFAKITGGSYAVKIRMTNEVVSGGGSIALTYAGADPHSVMLKKK